VHSLLQSYLWNEQSAHAKLEEIVWPAGPVCPYCRATDRIGAVNGKGARPPAKFCCRCRKQFRATIGTLFDGSRVPLHKWFQAGFLLIASNHSISTHRLHLRLEVTNKTALNMRRQIEGALNKGGFDLRGDACEGRSWTETFGRKHTGRKSKLAARRSSAAGGATAASAVGGADLPWLTALVRSPGLFSAAPTRQFLGFLEAVWAFARFEEDERFGEVLVRLGGCRTGLSPPSASVGLVSGRFRERTGDSCAGWRPVASEPYPKEA